MPYSDFKQFKALSIKECHAYLGNETIADTMMDRLIIHTAHKIEFRRFHAYGQ